MNNEKIVERFNYFEKIYLRFTLAVLGTAVLLSIIPFVFIDQISSISKLIANIAVSLMLVTVLNFFYAFFRIVKYARKISKLENNIGIMRTVSSLFLSPISFVILYILVIIMAFSSCTIQ